MIVILKQAKRQPFGDPSKSLLDMIDGWLIATDIHDARRKCDDQNLAAELYRMEFSPPQGKHMMQTPGYVMLVW